MNFIFSFKPAEGWKGPTIVTESSSSASSSVTTTSSKQISGTEVTTSPDRGITSTKSSKTTLDQEKKVTQQVTKSSRVMTGTLDDVQVNNLKHCAFKKSIESICEILDCLDINCEKSFDQFNIISDAVLI